MWRGYLVWFHFLHWRHFFFYIWILFDMCSWISDIVLIRSELEVESQNDEVAFFFSFFLLLFCPDRQTAFHRLL